MALELVYPAAPPEPWVERLLRAHEDLVALLAEVDAVLAETTVEGTACVL